MKISQSLDALKADAIRNIEALSNIALLSKISDLLHQAVENPGEGHEMELTLAGREYRNNEFQGFGQSAYPSDDTGEFWTHAPWNSFSKHGHDYP